MSNTIKAIKGKVLIDQIEQGERRTKSGIIILDDNGKACGIRERWGRVYAVGDDVLDINIGEWCLIKHGRWSRGVPLETEDGTITLRQIDWPDAVLLVADAPPEDATVA